MNTLSMLVDVNQWSVETAPFIILFYLGVLVVFALIVDAVLSKKEAHERALAEERAMFELERQRKEKEQKAKAESMESGKATLDKEAQEKLQYERDLERERKRKEWQAG